MTNLSKSTVSHANTFSISLYPLFPVNAYPVAKKKRKSVLNLSFHASSSCSSRNDTNIIDKFPISAISLYPLFPVNAYPVAKKKKKKYLEFLLSREFIMFI